MPWPSARWRMAHTHRERGNQAYALRLLGQIYARHDPPEIESATIHYRQALALADELACVRSWPTATSAWGHYMPG